MADGLRHPQRRRLKSLNIRMSVTGEDATHLDNYAVGQAVWLLVRIERIELYRPVVTETWNNGQAAMGMRRPSVGD